MEIQLNQVAKQFGRETVFQGVQCDLGTGSRTAILGPNGSGKSTLLQVICGSLVPTSGTIVHRIGGQEVPQEQVHRLVSIAAPYLGLYEELSLRQTIAFHARFKPFRQGLGVEAVARAARLEAHMEKPVMHFSSGMKQRLKLALAILSDTPLLCLDEPASNLDADAVMWFRELLRAHVDGRTLVVASNRQAAEHDVCDRTLEVEQWKLPVHP